MPKIQFDIPKEIDDKIRHYMIDHKLDDKRIAIIKIIAGAIK